MMLLVARRLCRSSWETAFSPESTAGSSEAKFNGNLFCVSMERRRGAEANCGLLRVSEERGRLSPSQSVIAYKLSSMMIRLSENH